MADELKHTAYRNFAEALAIFDRYTPADGYADFHAEHDQLWSGPDYENMTPEDLARLEELGWYPDEDAGSGFYTFM